ncbi:MAG: amidophosphoribosyltransferase [Oscillospiraceae bacterium]|nr:amidophosphoribosyltransferase [Oscillospiraceae bacterium]
MNDFRSDKLHEECGQAVPASVTGHRSSGDCFDTLPADQLHEECGVFGIMSPQPEDLAHLTYCGLFALQHRGQEGAGITVNDDGVFTTHKDLGLVDHVFTPQVLSGFPRGTMAVGHTRYGTTGGNQRRNCQPMEVNHQKGKMALVHNGNLSNAGRLRSVLEQRGAIFHTTSDTEIIAYLITQARLQTDSIEDAVRLAVPQLEGAFSLIVMSAQKLIAVRDPHGFRPLCIGQRTDGGYVLASESCALNAVGAAFLRDLEPGEMIVLSKDGGMQSDRRYAGTAPKRTCIFEYIYFARPDSVLDGVSVHAARKKAGALLAESHPADADVVIGVPDSGLDAALGFAEASGIPYGIGLIKNKYIGRTFIAPSQSLRDSGVQLKLSPICETVAGKRIVLIDDSIVRGTTSRRIVTLLRKAGAKEIHFRVSAPPFLHPCYYGTDIDSEVNLIANHHTVEEIAEIIGADSLGFLPLDALPQLAKSDGICTACFTGNYPTAIEDDEAKDRFERKIHG